MTWPKGPQLWPSRVWLGLGVFGATVAVCGTVLLQSQIDTNGWLPLPVYPRVSNAVEERAVTQLDDFKSWLAENQASGFVGELGWPLGADQSRWNAVADVWFQSARQQDLWVTGWAAGSHWGDYPMTLYGSSQGQGIDTARATANSLETALNHTHLGLYGVNVAGMEFGTQLTAQIPGEPGRDYFYEPASSYNYVASRGLTLIRLPLRWERLQPELGGPLKDAEVAAVRQQLDFAAAAHLRVVLDLHNYGRYRTDAGEFILGTEQLTSDQLADVWIKLASALGNHSAVIGVGIMNEPHDLPASAVGSAAQTWEAASQSVVSALRASGFHKTIAVSGYDWSSLARWRTNHPHAWIQDPDANIRYEAHHYWDANGSGNYDQSFNQELEGVGAD